MYVAKNTSVRDFYNAPTQNMTFIVRWINVGITSNAD